jgi:hypothetical protein
MNIDFFTIQMMNFEMIMHFSLMVFVYFSDRYLGFKKTVPFEMIMHFSLMVFIYFSDRYLGFNKIVPAPSMDGNECHVHFCHGN